jgi:hypothetical protein
MPCGIVEMPLEGRHSMNVRGLILCFALLLAVPVFARDKTDVIVMKNGDHLTGQVKGLDEGVLYVSMDYILGTSSGNGRRWTILRASSCSW